MGLLQKSKGPNINKNRAQKGAPTPVVPSGKDFCKKLLCLGV